MNTTPYRHTLPAHSRCGVHGTPTGEHARCSQCDTILPYWAELQALPSLSDSGAADLRIDTGDFRVWTSRLDGDDGDPYERTVYVETFDGTRWLDLGHYDGNEPPRSLPGMTPHALRGHLGGSVVDDSDEQLPVRRAVVRGGGSVETIAAYLPVAYHVVGTLDDYDDTGAVVLIEGVDVAGWTLDGYVIPRLASGCHWATEITLTEGTRS